MLRVAGVNQEDRYQSGGSQNALIWPAVKCDASLTNKHRTARLPTMSLPLKPLAGPLRPQQSDSRSALSDRSLFEHVYQFHFKIISRINSMPRTFLYALRATLALF